jgi:hypothetical protein
MVVVIVSPGLGQLARRDQALELFQGRKLSGRGLDL